MDSQFYLTASLDTQGNGPSESYNVFMEILLDTVRGEIAACLESSYDKISIAEAARRLNLKSEAEVIAFGTKVHTDTTLSAQQVNIAFHFLQKNWNVGADKVYEFANKSAKPKEPLPSIELAEQAIFYARELEMIV